MPENEIIEEFELHEAWARRQFSDMESDVALALLQSTITKSNSLRAFLIDRWKVAHKLAKMLMEKGIVRVAKESPNLLDMYKNALAIGVDSSRQLPFRILSTYYCPITSAIVYFDSFDKVIFDSNAPCKLFEETNLTPEEAIRKVQEEMYRCEVSAIIRVSSSTLFKDAIGKKEVLLMIDGPIIDPPNKKLYEGYIRERASALLACREGGALVIGCVKDLEGRHFLNFLKTQKDLQELATIAEGFGQDSQLIPFLFSTLYSEGAILETIPIKRTDPREIIDEYKKFGVEEIYRIYLTLGRGMHLGVEYLASKDDAVEIGAKVCNAVRAWGIPGVKIPLPVLAAHRRCNIKRGSAEYLYRELLTRALSCEEGANMFGAFSKGV
jgi:hypothetical protein